MVSDQKTPRASETPKESETNFSFGVREMRDANAAAEVRLEIVPFKPANENRGFDPYNSSGKFDRKNNWMRVGRR